MKLLVPVLSWAFSIALLIRIKLLWSLMAHLYQSSRVVGGSARDMTFFWSAMGRDSWKYLVTSSFFASFNWVISILNLDTCSSIEVLFPIFNFFIS